MTNLANLLWRNAEGQDVAFAETAPAPAMTTNESGVPEGEE
jgi:hypothetical protein